MEKIIIEINTEKFEDSPYVEMASICKELSDRFSKSYGEMFPELILDPNGNKIGAIKYIDSSKLLPQK